MGAISGQIRATLELRPDLDFAKVSALGKPAHVVRGIVWGLSLPIYSNDDEELFFEIHVPYRWEGNSDLEAHIHGYLDTANTDKNFKLQLSWEHFDSSAVVPDTSNNVEVQTATGTAPQYKGFPVEFTIDYDIDGVGDEIAAGERLEFRLRRIAATENEIVGNVVITHFGLVFIRDKLGKPLEC